MTSTHGSHTSHGNHGSHGSHGPHGSHGNSTYNSSNPYWSGSISGDHSVSAPTQQSSSLGTNKLGVYGGTGSLTALKNIAEAAKSASVFTSKAGAYTVPSNQFANSSSLTDVLNSARGSISKYRNGAIRANFHTNHANSMGGGSANHSSHSSTGDRTNTENTSNSGVNVTSTVYYGGGGHSSTARSAHANSSIPNAFYNTSVNPSYSVSSGSKITSSQLSGILAQIKKITSSSVPSFGTYQYIGSLGVAHASHGSHNSHGNHGSHSSHSSHSSCSIKNKINIESFNLDALQLINDIDIIKFNYNDISNEDTSIDHIGFIAENTSELFSTQYHDRMDYTNCIGILIKAVQELDKRIKSLELGK